MTTELLFRVYLLIDITRFIH